MAELSLTAKIWNRACQGGAESPRTGDIALADMLLFHSPAMNGGVLHAIECLSAQQLSAACAGYRYFGFESIADLLGSAQTAVSHCKDFEALEERLNQQYWALVPDDAVLVKRFECHYQENPLEYSPVH